MINQGKLILITGDRPEHRFVANRLSEQFNLTAILVDEGVPRSKGTIRRKRKQGFSRILGKAALKIGRWMFKTERRFREDLIRTLGEKDSETFLNPDLLTRIRGVNSRETAEVIRNLAPDRILIYGVAIVRERILKLSRLEPLNMHTGISPYYRGAACYFWPVHNRELHLLGATVHECTADIDGGKIFATDRAELQPGDAGLGNIFGRCVMVGARMYIEVLKGLQEGTAEGRPQDLRMGREYRAKMRGLRAELRVHRLLKAGMVDRWVQQNTAEDEGPEEGIQ